jgi:hypothetical protein
VVGSAVADADVAGAGVPPVVVMGSDSSVVVGCDFGCGDGGSRVEAEEETAVVLPLGGGDPSLAGPGPAAAEMSGMMQCNADPDARAGGAEG